MDLDAAGRCVLANGVGRFPAGPTGSGTAVFVWGGLSFSIHQANETSATASYGWEYARWLEAKDRSTGRLVWRYRIAGEPYFLPPP
jgi:hypothetical protein